MDVRYVLSALTFMLGSRTQDVKVGRTAYRHGQRDIVGTPSLLSYVHAASLHVSWLLDSFLMDGPRE